MPTDRSTKKNSRPRLVVFRISEQEHKLLNEVCSSIGMRSLSECVRQAALQFALSHRTSRGLLVGDLATLTSRLQEIDEGVVDLRQIIARVLGPDPERDESEYKSSAVTTGCSGGDN